MYIRILGNNDGEKVFTRRGAGFRPKQSIYVLVNDDTNGSIFFSVTSEKYTWEYGTGHGLSSNVGPFRVMQIRANPVAKAVGGGGPVPTLIAPDDMTVTVSNTPTGPPIATDTTPIQVVDEVLLQKYLVTTQDEDALKAQFKVVDEANLRQDEAGDEGAA